jgi:S-adenosylmethionine-diacylglycerol 3-amino-3-carboxypropyl transferase
MAKNIEERVQFDIVRYANCWEDANILCKALVPAEGKRVLSIASGGDNSFSLLAEGAEVVAADLSIAQLACVELKAAAIRKLDHGDVLQFIGIKPSEKRLAIYRDLSCKISETSKAFWDQNTNSIINGICHSGKFENFFRIFRTRILPLVHSRKTIKQLITPKEEEERRTFYQTKWNSFRWRLLFKIFVSRFVMGRLGRDPEFFRYVEGSVADRILERTKHALVNLPLHKNPYLDYILNGNYTQTLPPYLETDKFDLLRKGLDRLTLHQGTIQEAASVYGNAGFDGFNLSDIFEYLDKHLCKTVYGELLETARPGARFAYWNMLVPRSCPEEYTNKVINRKDLADELFRQDLAFFYSAFVVEEVMREDRQKAQKIQKEQ